MALMLLSSLNPTIFESARTRLSDVFSPVLILISRPFQNVALFFTNVQGLAELQAEHERLQDENNRLRDWYQMALLLESENKSLRELLNLKIDPQYEYVSARIMTGAGNTYVKSLLVAAGTGQGVNKGDAVLSGEGLVGRIIEAGAKSSRILLVTDINSRVPILIEDTLQHAIMKGTNTSIPKLIHFTRESDITEGGRIITSGHGGVYPPGLPIGRIMIDDKGQKNVKLFADTERLLFLRIVKKHEGDQFKKNVMRPINNE